MTYTCAQCGGTFDGDGDDDDDAAHAEAVALWGQSGHAPGMVVVCDACFDVIWQDVATSAPPNKTQT